MGWTKETREDLQAKADNGDTAAAATLERMRARNVENKRRSLARQNAQQATEKSGSETVEHHPSTAADEDSLRMPPPPPPPVTRPQRVEGPVMDLVGGRVEASPREMMGQLTHPGRVEQWTEGVKWKPLSEVHGEKEGKEELEKVKALEAAVAERKKALERMVKGKGKARED